MENQFITALGPAAPDDDDDESQQQRGLAIAALEPIEIGRSGYRVPSQSKDGFYIVNLDGDHGPVCSCPDFDLYQRPCKHIYAVRLSLRREEHRECGRDQKDGVHLPMTKKQKTYQRDWRAYDKAQNNESKHFEVLLRALCDRIVQPRQYGQGRPLSIFSDMAYCCVYKVYQQLSRRRVMTDIERVHERGFIDQVPSDSSISRFLNQAYVTSLLKHLVIISALPLVSVEKQFAIDASGFATQSYLRHYNVKRGREEKKARYVKAHVLCGTKSHIVTAAEVSEPNQSESPLLPHFLRTTRENFDVQELYADMGYSSKNNFEVAEEVGTRLFIPFKANTIPADGDDAWSKAYKFFVYKKDEFRAHYHQRSQVETVFHMDKSKTGPAVKAKNPTAQFNEVLCKILNHNIMVLIHEAHKLGIESELEKWVTDTLDRYDREQEQERRLSLAA